MEERFRLPARPQANPGAVVVGDRWRITVLTDGLLRLEWSPDGGFEDRASTFAWYRDLPVPDFEVVDGPDALEILTERLHLTYDREVFSAHGLQVQARGRISNHRSTWRYGVQPRSLGGTARTLDEADGRIPLESGVTSVDGVGLVDDSESFLFTADGWIASREGEGRIDLYVFAYGHDYTAAIQGLYAVSGPQPVLPRWALGNWWSRYHRYSADSYLELMDRFAAERLPFSVAVVDMDWHRVDSVPSQYGTGWTGYSWEPELFPDPRAFLAELHRRNMHVTLNVHPHEGVQPFEDAYEAMCEALGRDPGRDLAVAFDPTDAEFFSAYFDVLHRGLEDQGVDFWWIDWQQGTHSKMPGVDPLWMLNHFHFLDSGRDGRRPMTFSRYAGPGSHRYPVGFSGDTVISWESLDFQPEFTSAASDIGYAWWSHDIGGHLWGYRDDELAYRWVQYGVFSPINRLHSSSNPFLVKEPWMYPIEARTAMEESLRLRHRLIPYIHSMNHRASREGLPLVRPMYHLYPDDARAYEVPNQFAFGDQLLVAPVTTPADDVTTRAATRAWLPHGCFVDVFTELVYDGDHELDLHRDSGSIPVLLKAGGILPLDATEGLDATANPDRIEVLVAPGADGAFTLYEDDGTGNSVSTIPTAITRMAWSESGGSGSLRIEAAEGPEGIVPEQRTWIVGLLAVDGTVRASCGGADLDVDATSGRPCVTVEAATGTPLVIDFEYGAAPVTSDPRGRLLDVLNAAQCDNELKLSAWRTLTSDQPPVAQLAELQSLQLTPALLGALTEVLTAR